VWELSPTGEMLSSWYGRSIIRSCCKLDYGAAQQMIETAEDAAAGPKEWGVEGKVLHGDFTWDEVAGDVRMLHTLAAVRCRARASMPPPRPSRAHKRERRGRQRLRRRH